jgi:hypothetical protein
MYTHLAEDPDFVKRFEREAKNVAALRHPNIVQVFDFDLEGELSYMVMEFIDGVTLKTHLENLTRTDKPLPLSESIHIVNEIGQALAYAHAHNMIHRDVKPANVMVTRENRLILTDFGLAKILSGTSLTLTGGVVGTPAYMAPEQGMGDAGDPRADIYSLGVILYELATGQLPFDADTPLAIMLKHMNEPVPPPHTFQSDLPFSIETIILKSLAKKPEDRYQSVEEMLSHLQISITETETKPGKETPSQHAPTVPVQAQDQVFVAPPEPEVLPLPVDFVREENELAVSSVEAMLTAKDEAQPQLKAPARLPVSAHPVQIQQAARKQQRVFISYRHNTQPDERLADLLFRELHGCGHAPFIDRSMSVGTAWLDEIDAQMCQSDFLVVLLSRQSADSEMVKAEIHRAYQYLLRQGNPRILPVRISYEDMLPYAIDAFLDPVQYVSWKDASDDLGVIAEIIRVIEGGTASTSGTPVRPAFPIQAALSEDGRLLSQANAGSLAAPLPQFDPRFLDELEAPGGALRPNDRFYIERESDLRLRRELVRTGSTITIRGSRQVGKSSLLVRGLHLVRDRTRLMHLDLQAVDRSHLQTAETFLHYLARLVARKTQVSSEIVDQVWGDILGPQDKLTKLMEEEILPSSAGRFILALDEADRLLETGFATDFFSLLRSWHNSRALDDLWSAFNLVMVISTEPYLLIADSTQSPFNVGLKLVVDDFSLEQVQDLNRRHGEPVSAAHLPRFMALLNGHPYLTRKALYTLVAEKLSWDELLNTAALDHGPFGDHLRHQLWLMRDEPRLQEALKQIIRTHRCTNDATLFRLQRAGLVKTSGEMCACRCELYSLYFKDKFK